MATRLENLRLKRVDLVDVGASQGSGAGAHVVLFKRATHDTMDEAKAQLMAVEAGKHDKDMKKADLEALPNRVRSAFSAQYSAPGTTGYAYVEKVEDASVVACMSDGMAGTKYFRIPWAQEGEYIKFDILSKREVDKTWVEKATGFAEALMARQMGDVTEEIEEMVCAFCEAVESALSDETVEDKKAAVLGALSQFGDAVTSSVEEWASTGSVNKIGRKISSARLTRLKEIKAHVDKLIEEAEAAGPVAKRGNAAHGGDEMLDIKKALEAAPAEARAVIEAEVAKLTKVAEDATKAATTAAAEVKVAREEIATAKADLTKTKADLEKATAKDDPEAIWKGVSPAVRKLHEDTLARAESAEKIAKVERDERMKAVYIQKANTFKGLPISADDDWELLKAIDEKLDPKLAKRLVEVLKAADEIGVQAGLFKAVGSESNTPAVGTAAEKINKLAQELVMKDANGAMTIERATVRVMEIHPELYAQHVRETRGEA